MTHLKYIPQIAGACTCKGECEKYNDVSTFPPFSGIMCHMMSFSWREEDTEIKMEPYYYVLFEMFISLKMLEILINVI